jgi:hypothetical protein
MPLLFGQIGNRHSAIGTLLSQVRLEDVFKSAQENMTETPSSGRLVALLVGIVAIVLLFVVLHQFRKRSATPRPVNHHGRLLKEVAKSLPLKSSEIKQLKKLAEQQSCSSPLVLLLCPSLLAKALNSQPPSTRKPLEKVLQKLTPTP